MKYPSGSALSAMSPAIDGGLEVAVKGYGQPELKTIATARSRSSSEYGLGISKCVGTIRLRRLNRCEKTGTVQ